MQWFSKTIYVCERNSTRTCANANMFPIENHALSCASIIRASSRYFYMVLRHGRWLWSYQGRSMHWIIGALDVSWTYIGQNLSPMMRYTPALGCHFCQTLSAAVALSFIGHLYRADPRQDHHRALQACIAGPPDNWRRRISRPRQSWLRTMESILQPMNLRLVTVKRRAQDRSAWRKLVATATSSQTCSWRESL